MTRKTVITGIQSTGMPHLGNYVGAIQPALHLAETAEHDCFYFIADYHALTTISEASALIRFRREIAAAWLASGLDPQKTLLYCQSAIPEVHELAWILSCFAKKSLLNGAHAYKAAVARNLEHHSSDRDLNISMGLFCYPLLMAADILLLGAHLVPVGKDQLQHLEMTRDIAGRFNRAYGQQLVLPQALCSSEKAVLPGTDGRKMSKSYGNTIPLFCSENALKKRIAKIPTNSQSPEEAKNPDDSLLFSLYSHFATEEEQGDMRHSFANGVSWKVVKEALFFVMNREVAGKRERYEELMANPEQIDAVLQQGAQQVRERARAQLEKIRSVIGLA